MCGIAGVLSRGGRPQLQRAAEQMVRQLGHRGPDAHAVVAVDDSDSPNVVLGHTRLAIIDLSPAGTQPMRVGENHTITYNGEIYNFRDVAARLPNTAWQSRSDTEVLLRAYGAWGRDCVQHLRGMFAFAIWDA